MRPKTAAPAAGARPRWHWAATSQEADCCSPALLVLATALVLWPAVPARALQLQAACAEDTWEKQLLCAAPKIKAENADAKQDLRAGTDIIIFEPKGLGDVRFPFQDADTLQAMNYLTAYKDATHFVNGKPVIKTGTPLKDWREEWGPNPSDTDLEGFKLFQMSLTQDVTQEWLQYIVAGKMIQHNKNFFLHKGSGGGDEAHIWVRPTLQGALHLETIPRRYIDEQTKAVELTTDIAIEKKFSASCSGDEHLSGTTDTELDAKKVWKKFTIFLASWIKTEDVASRAALVVTNSGKQLWTKTKDFVTSDITACNSDPAENRVCLGEADFPIFIVLRKTFDGEDYERRAQYRRDLMYWFLRDWSNYVGDFRAPSKAGQYMHNSLYDNLKPKYAIINRLKDQYDKIEEDQKGKSRVQATVELEQQIEERKDSLEKELKIFQCAADLVFTVRERDIDSNTGTVPLQKEDLKNCKALAQVDKMMRHAEASAAGEVAAAQMAFHGMGQCIIDLLATTRMLKDSIAYEKGDGNQYAGAVKKYDDRLKAFEDIYGKVKDRHAEVYNAVKGRLEHYKDLIGTWDE